MQEKIQLPLSIPLLNDEEEINKRINFLSSLKVFDNNLDYISHCYKLKLKQKLTSEDIEKLKEISKAQTFKPIYRKLVFLHCFITKIESIDESLIFNLKESPTETSDEIREDLRRYLPLSHDLFIKSRSELILNELISPLINDTDLVAKLLKITPQYLQSPYIRELIEYHHNRGVLEKNPSSKKISKQLLGALNHSTKRKAKNSKYWYSMYFYRRLTNVIKNYIKGEFKDQLSYIKEIPDFELLSDESKNLILNPSDDSPENIALSVLTSRGNINSPDGFLKIYRRDFSEQEHGFFAIIPSRFFKVFDLEENNPFLFYELKSFQFLDQYIFESRPSSIMAKGISEALFSAIEQLSPEEKLFFSKNSNSSKNKLTKKDSKKIDKLLDKISKNALNGTE